MGLRYPIHLELDGKPVVLVGGGTVAERKAKGLLAAGARVTVIAPKATKALAALAQEQRIAWIEAPFAPGMIETRRPVLVFCTARDAAANAAAEEEAHRVGALVNEAVHPEQTDFAVPAHFRRGRLLFTVSTDGVSPALSRALRERLEEAFPPVFGDWLDLLGTIRREMKERLDSGEARQAFWRAALRPCVLDLVKDGDLRRAEVEVRNAVSSLGAEP